MKTRATRFPSLGSDAALADVQVRQTLAMGLVPLGMALLLMAAMAPDWPTPGLWIGAGASMGGMALLRTLWRMSGNRYMKGFSTTHFLVRYLFIVLCPALLWIVFGEVVVEKAGWLPPVLLGALLLLYPVGRILQEREGSGPGETPRVEIARIACGQLQMVLGVFAMIGGLAGAVVDAQEDYPTDPTALLLFLWMLALLAVLGGAVMVVGHWKRLFGKSKAPPQLLDDVSSHETAKNPLRFGSEKF